MKTHDLPLHAVLVSLAVIAGCSGEDTAQTGGSGPGESGGDTGTTAPGAGGSGGIDTGGPGGQGTGGNGTGGETSSTGGAGGAGGVTSCKAVWSRAFQGDIVQQFVTDILPDEKGDMVVCGYFEGTMDTGDGVVLTSEASDIVLVKLDSAGDHVWTRQLGGPENQYGQIVSDGEGGLILTGQMEGSMDLGVGPMVSEGGDDAFVARFDANGEVLWNKRFGGPGHQSIGKARVDPKGDIVFAGKLEETLDLGGGPLVSAGNIDGFLAKFDAQGNHLWSKSYGDSSQQLIASMDLDSAGNILLTGMFVGTLDLGGDPLLSAGGFDVFVAKLDPDGNPLWTHQYGDGQIQTAAAVAAGPGDSVLVTGTFQGKADFGGGPMTAGAGLLGDLFVLQLDADGKHMWSRAIGGDAQRIPYAISLDSDGGPVVTGQFTGVLDLGGATLQTTSAGDYDAFVFKMDASGETVHAARFGDAQMQVGEVVALAAPDQPLLGGGFDGTIDLGAGPLVNAPHDSPVDFDFFVTRLDCTK